MPLFHDPACRTLTAWGASIVLVMELSLGVGCAHDGPQNLPPSASLAAVEQHMGKPTLILPRPTGGVRWVFAKGPYGRHTWMLDMDTSGHLESWHQALGEAQFSDLPAGMDREALLLRLGPPADKRARGLMARYAIQNRLETHGFPVAAFLCTEAHRAKNCIGIVPELVLGGPRAGS